MKKNFIIFLIIWISLLWQNNSFAFVLDFNSSWFYSNISENIDSLEWNIYTIDLEWSNWTRQKINDYSWTNCLNDDLNENEIRDIVINWNIWFINTKISDDCKDDEWRISVTDTNKLLTSISRVHNDTVEQSREKTRQLINLWSTWIYTDGLDENSPFDLIKDLENIDSIIFSEPSTVYEWNEFIDVFSEIEEKSQDIKQSLSPSNNNLNDLNNINDIIDSNEVDDWVFPILNSDWVPIFSKNHCTITSWDSWLSTNTIINVKNDINNDNSDSDFNDTNNNDDNSWEENNNWSDENNNESENYSGNYSKVNDNNQFPCDWIFCIDIEFITYEHNLLWWWFQDISIEYLLNRSNEHLKKFAATSLVQSKMSLNNFELWLKDLNLPDIFHLWFQVSTKPVPILELVPEEKANEDNWIFESENMLKFYYESYWLDYNRRNDLSLITQIERDKQAWLNSQLSPITTFTNNIWWINEYMNQRVKQRDTMRMAVENLTQWWNISNFETQLKEISTFNKSINDYVNNLAAIIKNINKIPQDTWTN